MCLCTFLGAHITFENLSLNEALEKAATEKKLVFVDTHASWCAPCKIMDKVFEEKNVGHYFNANFINIKIDMEGPNGDFMLKQYGVVWLPTLLVLDQTGNVLTKIDKLISGDDLISTISESLSSPAAPLSHEFNKTPFPTTSSKHNTDYNPEKKEEVIYIHDQRVSSGRPHIMYHEAYLHLQLMDGKHYNVVKKYLSTQQHWSSEKNIKFIFDFLQDVNTKEFDYFIAHKQRFEEVIGKDKVATSLAFLVKKRIEQGFPRVTLKETINLYRHLFDSSVEEKAYLVYLNNLLKNNLQLEYISTVKEYLRSINPSDHKAIYTLVNLNLDRSEFRTTLTNDLERMKQAIALENSISDYHFTIARIYYYLANKESALSSIVKAISLSNDYKKSIDSYNKLHQKINAL